MTDCEYRWSKDFALGRIFVSLAGWFSILLFPAGFAYLISMDKPYEHWVAAGIVAVLLVCWGLHSRKYWLRFSDRSVQVALRPEGIWAKQLKGRDIRWGEILSLKGVGMPRTGDLAVLYLHTMGGEVRLDLTGLDTPLGIIMREIEARCNAVA
jgi:hypothetical protein